MHGSCMERTAGECWTANCVERGCVVRRQKIVVDDTVITRRTREKGFKVLGAWTTFDGHFVKELAEREVIAWRSFHAIRKLLRDNKLALRHRLHLLSSCVTSSLYWCSFSWILTQRRMMYVPRYSTETPEGHMIRWSKLLHNCQGKHNMLHGDEMYCASCHRGQKES